MANNVASSIEDHEQFYIIEVSGLRQFEGLGMYIEDLVEG